MAPGFIAYAFPMPYIPTIDPADASPELAALYKRVGNPDGTIDEVMAVHSLSPASLEAHFQLYVQCMHKPSPLSKLERELVGSVVSRANGCRYCLVHHAAGLGRFAAKEGREGLAEAVLEGQEGPLLTGREAAMVGYAEKLAVDQASVSAQDVQVLRDAGLEGREVVDLAQVVGYFCYANRIVLGLGAELESFEPGQHPGV